MTLAPTLVDLIARARTDLRLGLPVVLLHGQQRYLVLAAEGLDEDRWQAAKTLGVPILAITS